MKINLKIVHVIAHLEKQSKQRNNNCLKFLSFLFLIKPSKHLYLKEKQASFCYNMYVKKVHFYIVFLFLIVGVGI